MSDDEQKELKQTEAEVSVKDEQAEASPKEQEPPQDVIKAEEVENMWATAQVDAAQFDEELAEKAEEKKTAGEKQSITKLCIKVVALGMAAFQLWTGVFGTLDSLLQREIHLIFAIGLVFLIYPGRKKRGKNTVNWLDIALIVAMLLCFAYMLINYEWIRGERIVYLTEYKLVDFVVSIGLLALILEATRRILGLALPIVILVSFVYVATGQHLPGIFEHGGFRMEMFLDSEIFTMQGVFGVPLGVASTYLFMFILFGSVLNTAGFGDLLLSVARAIAGKRRGGPAKVAVLASAFFGMLSGSSTANAVTTGTFTIPLMKRVGLKPEFACGVEAAASTGGQIMPPILGAAGLLMVQLAGISYLELMKWSILPAILYFASIWFMVDFRAGKDNLVTYEEKVEWRKEVKEKWHLLIPIFVMIGLLFAGRSIMLAGTAAVLSTYVVSSIRKSTRLSLKQVIDSLIDASKQALNVSAATATAGMLVGVVGLTGLGIRFSDIIINMAAGSLFFALVFTMFAGLILGMGLPTAPAYIVQVALIVPALIKLGIPGYVAHLFVVYFAPISMITPPVAITAFAAAGVGGASQMRTGVEAVKLAIAGFIVPFMFVYNQNLLLEGIWYDIILAMITSGCGVYALAFSVQGFWKKKLNLIQRLMGFGAALLLIDPGIVTDTLGIGLCVLLYIWQRYQMRNEAPRLSE